MKKFFTGLMILIFIAIISLIAKIYSQANIDEARIADAIVVLGASQWNGKPSPVFKARLDHALDLYNKNLSQNIILTGGVGENEILSEAQVGKNYLVNKGINEKNIFTENIGLTSWQSLNEVVKILDSLDLNSIILTSDGFHIMRLKKMAKDLKIEAYSSPAPNSPIAKNKFIELKYILRETGVFFLYLLFEI